MKLTRFLSELKNTVLHCNFNSFGIYFWGRQFVYLWVGNEYSDAYWIGLLLMISVYVPCFQNIGLEIQKAKEYA